MWYMVYDATWKRLLVLIAFFFYVTRIDRRWMKKQYYDSHDASFRDTPAHM